MKSNKTLVFIATILIAATTATAAITVSTIMPLAFADSSETETELEAEQENNCSGFRYLCQGTATATIGPSSVIGDAG